MMDIKPFSIGLLSQISLLTTVLALINMGISSILGISKRIEELEIENSKNSKGHFRLPKNIEKLKNFDHKSYANKFFISFILVIVIYFILIILNNLNTDFNMVEKIFLDYKNKKFIVDIAVKGTSNILISSGCNKFWIVLGTLLSWVQLFVIIYIYFQVIVVMRKYIKALID